MATEDLSNYWFPKLWFHDPKTGKLEAVPDGGLTVYYLFCGVDDKKNGGSGLKAFQNGLKMLTGTLPRESSRRQRLPRLSHEELYFRRRCREWERGNRST